MLSSAAVDISTLVNEELKNFLHVIPRSRCLDGAAEKTTLEIYIAPFEIRILAMVVWPPQIASCRGFLASRDIASTSPD